MTHLRHRSMLNELNQLLNQGWPAEGDLSSAATSEFVPAVDIKEEANQFVLYVDVPGVPPSDIQINMENGVLTIQGEKSHQIKKDTEAFSRIERVSGSFYRRFSLPDTADAQEISAKTKHGVLEITIPKIQRTQPRKIDIKVEE